MTEATSQELNRPLRSPGEAALQRKADALNYQLGIALSALRTISRECPDPVSQDVATASLIKITKAQQP